MQIFVFTDDKGKKYCSHMTLDLFVDVIIYELKQLGFGAKLINNKNISDALDDDIIIIYSAWYDMLKVKELNKNCKIIIYNTESYFVRTKYPSMIKKNKHIKEVWDYQHKNIDHLKNKFSINSLYIPPCYSDSMIFDETNNTEKDIDILFYGALNKRRSNIIDKLKEKHNVYWRHFFKDIDEQNSYIKRSKILLVIYFHEENKPIDFFRISYLLANKCFILHEDVNDDLERTKFAEHIKFSEYDNIVSDCDKYLSSGNLDEYALKSHNFFKENYHMKNMLLNSNLLKNSL